MAVTSSDVVVDVKNLSYSYDGRTVALDNVSFTISRRRLVAVLGPNGAGKTTLLKCMLGLLKPLGAVYINGKLLGSMKNRELARLIGYVPQKHHSIFAYRVLDFVLMGRAPHHGLFSLPGREEYNKALEILGELGIRDLAERTISEISGGQLQLVLIARALVQDARILLLDEPTAHLDVYNKLRVLEITKKLVSSKLVDAIVMALHDPLIAAMFCDEVVLLDKGRIVAHGSPREVLTPKLLYNVYRVYFDVFERDDKIIVVPRKPS